LDHGLFKLKRFNGDDPDEKKKLWLASYPGNDVWFALRTMKLCNSYWAWLDKECVFRIDGPPLEESDPPVDKS
jgi:hypothetical protein